MEVLDTSIPDKLDNKLVSLIKILNEYGIKTYYSCSGHNKLPAYIAIDRDCLVNISISNNLVCLYWNMKI